MRRPGHPPDDTAARHSAEDEVEKFDSHAAEWWDTGGQFRPLHVMNPARIAVIKDAVASHFARAPNGARPFKGLTLLDVACGGGLIAEPMTRLGASVTGIDRGPETIKVAAAHAERLGLTIDYRNAEAAELAEAGRAFDIVLALEVVEHVADPAGFVAAAAALVKPGGLMIVSTINRTLAALARAKIGAEYLLRWVPRGTHTYNRFVTVGELRFALELAGLEPRPPVGLVYRSLKGEWTRSLDTSVNYVMAAAKP